LESNIWATLKDGKKSTLVKIYKEYYDELFNYGLRICRREELTRDCIQELFIIIWLDKLKFSKIENPKPYVFRILRNTILDGLKKIPKYAELSNTELIDPMLSKQDFIISHELSDEMKAKLDQALETLTTRQKEIIFLKFYNGLNYEEISIVTSIKYQSVRNLCSTALKKLKKNMIPAALLIQYMQMIDLQ
jgi:RNA polymerase sigma factor (sigma-70 family)